MSLSELHGFLDAIVYGSAKNLLQQLRKCHCCFLNYKHEPKQPAIIQGNNTEESDGEENVGRIDTLAEISLQSSLLYQ